MSDTTNNVTGTQNNVWGSQYNAQRDQYINCTFIGADLPLTNEEWRHIFAAYITHLRAANGKVKLIGAENSSLPLDGVYVNLKAARRYEDHEQEHRIRAALREYEEKLNKDERLSPGERFRLIDECHFLFRGGLQPEAEQIALDQAVITYPRLVIVGEPGSGKTTLLRYLAYKFARVGEESEQVPGFGYRRLPILVRLTELVKQNYDVLAAAVADYQGNKANLSKLLRQYMERGLALFLFDGLDEVSGSERTAVREWLNRFADGLSAGAGRPQPAPLDQQAQGNRIIVTSRINSYFAAALDNANAHFVIQPLKTADRQLFLTSWYKAYETSQGRAVHEQAAVAWARPLAEKMDAPNLERLAEVPLLLSFLAYIWRTEGSLPSSRVQLYARMVKRMMAQRGEQPLIPATEKRIIPALARLAFCLNANRDSGSLSRAEAMQFFDPNLQAHWDWLVETAGLLALRGSRTRTDDWGDSVDELLYGFPHRTFEEYFAALYLAAKPDDELLPLLRRLLHDPRWDEVIVLALGHIYYAIKRERAENLLEKLCLDPKREQSEYEVLFHRDLLFAIRAAGDGVTPKQEMWSITTREISEIYKDKGDFESYFSPRNQVNALLENIAKSRIADLLCRRLVRLLDVDGTRSVALYIIRALSAVGDNNSMVIDRLLESLHDLDYMVVIEAAYALDKIGKEDKRVFNAVVSLLESGNDEIRKAAADILQKLGMMREVVTNTLRQLLNSSNESVGLGAAVELTNLNEVDGQVVEVLESAMIARLTDRLPAVQALIHLNSFNDYVIQNLMFEVMALCNQPKARLIVEDWIKVISDLYMKNDVVINALISWLNSEEDQLKADAVWIIGAMAFIGSATFEDERVINPLLEMLDDDFIVTAISAATTLDKIGGHRDKVLTTFLKFLKDESNAEYIAESLGYMGNQDSQASSILNSLLNLGIDKAEVSLSAIRSLVTLGQMDEKAVEKLREIVRFADSYTQVSAASLLISLNLREDIAVEVLLRFVEAHSVSTYSDERGYLESFDYPHRQMGEVLDVLGKVSYSNNVASTLYNLLKNKWHPRLYSGELHAAYEALYSIVSSQRSHAAEGICNGLLDEPTD